MSERTEDVEQPSSLTSLLSTIFLHASQTASSLPSTSLGSDPNAQLLALLQTARQHIQSLALLSSNDVVDDLPTSSLRAVLLESVYADAVGRTRTAPGNFEARKQVLVRSRQAYKEYLSQLISLGVLPSNQSSNGSSASYVGPLTMQSRNTISSDSSPFSEDAAKRRQSKIATMKLERAITSALDAFRRAARARRNTALGGGTIRSTSNGVMGGGSSVTEIPETAFDLLALPRPGGRGEEGEEDDDEEEENETFIGGSNEASPEGVRTPTSLRSYLLLLMHLHALRAIGSLDSLYSELQLLQNMPASSQREAEERLGRERAERQSRERSSSSSSSSSPSQDWRLDQRWGVSNSSPLMDPKGKPLRPFTILPSGSSAAGGSGRGSGSGMGGTVQSQMEARQRMRDEVFRPSHRLPTMSIDEYLEEEKRRGNVIEGGGEASANQPTSTEQRRARAEGENANTSEAEEAEEEQRRKDIEWDAFTEANPRGTGNTMNRG